MDIEGQCHCANLSFSFHSPNELVFHACSCSFVRSHGAKTVIDPQGRAVIRAKRIADVRRYRFGLALSDYLICRECGVYLGAVMELEGKNYATLNVRASNLHDRPATSVSYATETAEQRIARRRLAWTPVELFLEPAR